MAEIAMSVFARAVGDELDVVDDRSPPIISEEIEDAVPVEESWRMRKPRSRSIAAPAPEACPVAESGANGIEHDVAAGLEEVRLPFYDGRAIATLEQVSRTVVPVVEPLRISAVHQVHPLGEVWVRCLDHQMEVVGHQAVGVAPPEKALDGLGD